MIGNGRMPALVRKELTQFLRDKIMLFLVLYLYTAEVIRTYHFCSTACAAKFDKDPQRYVPRQTPDRDQ